MTATPMDRPLSGYQPLTVLAQAFIAPALSPGGYAVDATVGNGHDSLFLARSIGPEGHLFGFDVQASAIDLTFRRLRQVELDAGVSLFHEGHERLAERLAGEYGGRIQAIMFNLGYLPGGDKGVTTRSETTLAALQACEALLMPGGRLTILAYTGHPGGEREAETVELWLNGLDPAQWLWHGIRPESMHRPPRLHCCERTPGRPGLE